MSTSKLPDPELCWPDPAHYACKCHKCGESYFGPKRSGTCWKCVPETTREWWDGLHKEKTDVRNA